MSQKGSKTARGATTFDFAALHEDDFELMNFLLIQLEYPDAIKPANVHDGGADAVLREPNGIGVARCWQSKRFVTQIRWDKCEKSLATALKTW